MIAGLHKGRILKAVKGLTVRPAADRVKQTVFDILAARRDLEGMKVLDLFAGSGSLGIEALSRGAAHVTFVEHNEEAARSIEENVHMLGLERKVTLYTLDALGFLSRNTSSYDIVFVDPPYIFDGANDIPRIVFSQKVLNPRGYMVFEHSTDTTFDSTALFAVWPVKKFGRTVVTFFQHPMTESRTS